MRVPALALLACLAAASAGQARPLHVHVRGGAAAAVLLHEGILTREQLACSEIVPGRLGSRRVEHVSIFEKHGGGCPGAAVPPTFLFDVYVDRTSGVVDYTPDTPEELQTILPLPHPALD